MRHRKKINHLSRKSAHRKAMLANMATSLIMHKRINTTLAKAKALRVYIEPLITKSKDDTTHSRRVVFSYLQSKDAITELFREISAKVADRPGGYTRIIKTGSRLGDNAEMCMMELVDYNENLLGEKDQKKAKTTRRRRGTKKKVEETADETTTVETEDVKEEVPVVADEAKEEKAPEAKVDEPKAEEKKEEPKAEDKEEKIVEDNKPEVKAVEAKPEVKVEKPVKEEKKEDVAGDNKENTKEESK